jgi:hypothetical protein
MAIGATIVADAVVLTLTPTWPNVAATNANIRIEIAKIFFMILFVLIFSINLVLLLYSFIHDTMPAKMVAGMIT